MVNIQFCSAKNGKEICSVNGIALHSCYDPDKEAERIFATEKPNYTPQTIIVIASGLPYYGKKLHESFPHARLISIQATGNFPTQPAIWDEEWTPKSNVSLSSFLAPYITEETAAGLWFTVWPAGQRIWHTETAEYVATISKLLQTAVAVHHTRAYFGRRWLLNIVRNTVLIKNPVTIATVQTPIVIAAAGPSLSKMLPIIQQAAPHVYIIAVSSAFSALTAHGIIPDMCITSDGGFYAAEHLNRYRYFPQANLPVIAVASEGFVPSVLLEQQNILMLAYGTPLEQALCQNAELSPSEAKRNGTVSGTAAELALSLTQRNVYIAGLDLQNSGGKSHTAPNEAAQRRSTTTTRMTPETGAITEHDLSLDTYAQWFESRPQSFTKRFFILGPSVRKFSSLQSVSSESFLIDIQSFSHDKNGFTQQCVIPQSKRLKNVATIFNSIQEQITTTKEHPTAENIANTISETSITGDFIRYAAWQELTALTHAGNNADCVQKLCDTALDALKYIRTKLKHLQEARL